MKVYVSVVSHKHFDLIRSLKCLSLLSKDPKISVWILDNVGEKGFSDWCSKHNINYSNNYGRCKGFGENNNFIFNKIKINGLFSDGDFFLVLNPDVVVSSDKIISLYSEMVSFKAKVGTLNLYVDYHKNKFDNSVREFPCFYDFFASFFLKKNKSIIDKNIIYKSTFVDWAAGSFLMFENEHFEALNGFDENYFMYCEDIDICLRSAEIYKERVLFCPNIAAIHLAQHASQSIFSKHFFWHIKSIARYLKKRWFGVYN